MSECIRPTIVFLIITLVLIPVAYSESISVGRGSSVAVSEGSSAEGILVSDDIVTQSSVSSIGIIDELNIGPWVKNAKGDYVEIGVKGTNVDGFSYSDNYYHGKGSVWVSDAVWAQQRIDVSSADSFQAYARASNSAGDRAGADLNIKYGSLKGYYNAAYAGPAPWLGMDRVASVQQTLDSATGNEILAQTWATDHVVDAAGASTSVKQGTLYGYSVLAEAAGYSNRLKAAGVSVDSMSASSYSGSIYQLITSCDHKGDTSVVSLDKATSATGYNGNAYAYDATASATETGKHITGSFVGTAKVGTATNTRTPNFGSEYDLNMVATTGSTPTGNLGYYVDPTMATTSLGAIQGAVNAAQSGDTINVATGTYYENVAFDKSLTLIGAGSIKTIVDGMKEGPVFSIGTVNPNVNVALSGMTIQNGKAQRGGGIYNAGILILKDCIITQNTASSGDSSGGGIYNKGAAMITGSIISGNSAHYGGGILNEGTATITDCAISGNAALKGGGINNVGTATIIGGTISGNNAERYGGGIYTRSPLTITASIISKNIALDDGGGIYIHAGWLQPNPFSTSQVLDNHLSSPTGPEDNISP